VDDAVVSLVFTTQSTTNVSVAVAAAIREGAQTAADAAPAATCTPLADFVRCEGALSLTNYRDADGRIDDAVSALRYDLPYTLLLPVERDAPAPLIVLGHGLGGDRSIGADVAQALSPEGFAVLAIDAVGHGDHPTRPAGDPNLAVLDFLGLDIGTQTVRGLRLRDNLRQSTYDKLQVLAVLQARPDVDGDGALDLDVNRIAYWGVSLGGIMGSEPIALSDAFDAAVLTVAGARLMPIVTEADSFAGFKPIIGNLVGGVAELDRGLPVVQALVDGGDPVAYAPHVLRDRLPGAGERAPHLLQQMVIDDEIVSNGTNRSLARALGVPHVPPFSQEVGLIDRVEAAPVAGNLEGERTAGLFQFDRMRTTPNGRPVKASHNNALGLEGFGQVFRFLATWRDGGAPELMDPYTEFMTP
jgi:pimeloyl-ACP methyl ester carboxylesterase